MATATTWTPISDPEDPRIEEFLGLRDHELRRRRESPNGDMAGILCGPRNRIWPHEAQPRLFRFAVLRFTRRIIASTRPGHLETRKASPRATAPGVTACHRLAFLQGGAFGLPVTLGNAASAFRFPRGKFLLDINDDYNH